MLAHSEVIEGASNITPMVNEMTLAEMADSTDAMVREELRRIRAQVKRLHEFLLAAEGKG